MIDLPSNLYQIGQFTVNCSDLTVGNEQQSIKLPVKVFELLKLFIVNENNSVLRSEAIEIIWQGNEGVGKRGFTNAMWHLRKTFSDLGAESEEVFKTLRKVGYILVITPLPATPETSAKTAMSASTKPSFSSSKVYLILGLMVVMFAIAIYAVIEQFGASLPVAEVTEQIDSETNFQGIEEHPAVSNDGHYLAFRWVRESSKGQLYIKDLQNEDAPLRILTQTNDEEGSPAWSADDSSLAYIRQVENDQCQVRVRNLVTNQDELIDSGCVYNPLRHGLSWSPDGKSLLYPKEHNDSVALFSYDLQSNEVKQVSFPQENARDVMAVWAEDSKSMVFIREQYVKAKLVLLNQNGEEQDILANEASIVGLTWDYAKNEIYTNLLDDAHFVIKKYNVSNNRWHTVSRLATPSNLHFSNAKAKLFLARFSSREYIVQKSLIDGREMRRVSSSSRDMYASYSAVNSEILFLSNRDDNWDVWIKTAKSSRNLTKGKGVALVPSVSPDGKQFVVNIKLPEQEQYSLYLGNIASGELTEIELGNLESQSPTWSHNGEAILFTANADEKSALFQYQLATKETTMLSQQNEKKGLQGSDGMFYMSRDLQDGLWQFNPLNKQYKRLTTELDENDFGSFFWQDNHLYYLARTETEDLVKMYTGELPGKIVARYPANTIKKYFGISAADANSILISLVSLNDADIYSLSSKDTPKTSP